MLVANFVHLGGNLPEHLALNIDRFKRLFPDIPISLVVDEKCDLSKVVKNIWKIHVYESADKDFSKLLYSLSYDQSFRNGFWIKTLERIFAFIEFHQTLDNDTKLLHIESDVILMPNFPWNKLSRIKLPPLGWCSFSPDYDVAALVYSKNQESSQLLKRFLIELLRKDSNLNDMIALNCVAKNYPEHTFYFPIVGANSHELDNLGEEVTISSTNLKSKLFKQFQGVFDGAALGMYLTGTDPRNTFGRRLIHNKANLIKSNAFINPQLWQYSVDLDGNLWLEIESQKIPIYCLHIHSKNLKLFDESWNTELNRLISLPKSKKYDGFSLSIFLMLILDNFKRKTLFRFLFNPFRNKLRSLKIWQFAVRK